MVVKGARCYCHFIYPWRRATLDIKCNITGKPGPSLSIPVVAHSPNNATNNNTESGSVLVLTPPSVMTPHPTFPRSTTVEPALPNKNLEVGAHVRAKSLSGGCRVPTIVHIHRPANSPPPILSPLCATVHVLHVPSGHEHTTMLAVIITTSTASPVPLIRALINGVKTSGLTILAILMSTSSPMSLHTPSVGMVSAGGA